MINDLLTSSKGPGFIGLILGLAVLMGFGSLAVLVLEDGPGGKGLGGQVKDKEKHLRKLKFKAAKWMTKIEDYADKKKIASECRETESLLERKQALLAVQKTELAEVEAKVAQTGKKIEDYKDRFKLYERGRAVGEKIDQLTIKNGKKYEQVVIRRVSNEGMDIRHKNGGTLVVSQLLPDELYERFQFSAKDKEAVDKMKKQNQRDGVRIDKSAEKSTKIRDLRHKIGRLKFELSGLAKEIVNGEVAIKSKNTAAQRAGQKARVHRQKASAARAAGRHSMQGALATQEEAKAVAYKKSAGKLETLVHAKRAEAGKARRVITTLENELNTLLSTKK